MKIEPNALQGLIRDKFDRNELNEFELNANPFEQLTTWLEEAHQTGIFPLSNAFSLSTVSKDNFPASRIVLMHSPASGDLRFYTQYGSDKALDISLNPRVCANFYWPIIERQIQIKGVCKKITESEADIGFRDLDRDKQLSSWASLQSEEINRVKELEEKFSGFKKLFEGREIPRPSRWGGYRIEAERFEFWQFRPSHFNDRIRYSHLPNGQWKIQRISP